jgi:hypothetical protein
MPARAATAGVPAVGGHREPVPVAEATARAAEPSRAAERPAALVVVAALPAAQPADLLATLPPVADRPRPGERIARNPSAPDVVQVSIGRVDVRATVVKPAPSAPAARQPAGEALSLGDYLRGKGESS